MSDAGSPTPDPNEAKQRGTNKPKPRKKAPLKRRTHAEATDKSIQLLKDQLKQCRRERNEEIARMLVQFSEERERLTAELTRLRSQVEAERETNSTIADDKSALAVSNASLLNENAALRREAVRAKILEVIATFLTIVGGGILSYTADQDYKDVSLLLILIGGGVFALNFIVGVVIGPFRREK